VSLSISDLLPEPSNKSKVYGWNNLSTRNSNTLKRAIERSDSNQGRFLFGFSFELLSLITIDNLLDARNTGSVKAQDLIDELVEIFENIIDEEKNIEDEDIAPESTEDQSSVIEILRNFISKMGNSDDKDNHSHHDYSICDESISSAQLNPFENCDDLDSFYSILESEILKLPKVDQRTLSMLKHRNIIFPGPGKTLDQIGQEWGLTRERVRQIVDKFSDLKIENVLSIPVINRAVSLLLGSDSEADFESKLTQHPDLQFEDFSWRNLLAICRLFSFDESVDAITDQHRKWISVDRNLQKTRDLIRLERSKFGLYDLRVLSKKYEITDDFAFKLIAEIYPRSIRCGNLVLARTMNLDTMFENSIAKQLKVSSPLGVKVLFKGLQRTGRYRDVALIGTTAELNNMILELAGDPPSYEKIKFGLIKEVEFQTIEKWLIEIFSDTTLGILHMNEVVNFALRDGTINVSSVNIYLLNSPIMRSHGRSLYSLVGTEVTEALLDDYIKVIRGSTEASEVTYEMTNASNGILCVKPNLNVISSGIVFLPSSYKKMFEGFEFESSCSCGQLETVQEVKFTASGFWTGFTAMIRHGFSMHGMTKNSLFRFDFNFDQEKVRLLVD
jgi:DNA-directed RNA polymerase specialized sigma subunit